MQLTSGYKKLESDCASRDHIAITDERIMHKLSRYFYYGLQLIESDGRCILGKPWYSCRPGNLPEL